MRTKFRTKKEYADVFLEIANNSKSVNDILPINFIKSMKENIGAINLFSPYKEPADGLERKNPIVVALGDSVTGGHFEFTVDIDKLFEKDKIEGKMSFSTDIEITDARECYLEKFREMLIDKYEKTSVSVINSGIAGDNLYGMKKRLYRDVIRYQPDLILINGSLNWPEECGGNEEYRNQLLDIVRKIKSETMSDIIMMTPNMEIPGPFANSNSKLEDRVKIVREVADIEKICLADTYSIWKEYVDKGYALKELLANGCNHPSTVGHEVYAITLMKLLEQ